MSQKRDRIIYFISTGLLTAMTGVSAVMYFFKFDDVSATFEKLGYPSHIVLPLATAKILGLIAIWTRKFQTLKEWAYAGFFFDFVLAFLAHYYAQDGEFAPAIGAAVLLLVSYFFEKKLP
ncbi:MAG: DoxX family protein [Bacteroidota bacterium]